MSTVSFPRQQARTRRFTLGVPRALTPLLTPDGPLVLFLRTDTGTDAVTHLWRHDPATGRTDKLVDARSLLADDEALPPVERARRERTREQASGIVSYAVDESATMAAFALGGRVHTVELASGRVVAHDTEVAVDPRPAPDGGSVAYHARGGLHLLTLPEGPANPGRSRPLLEEDDVSFGAAEFVAAEEMGRTRGFWWGPTAGQLAVTRVDESRVAAWTIADPANPATPGVVHRYPAAGTANAEVTLWVLDVETGRRVQVETGLDADDYLAAVSWGRDPLTVVAQARDQRTLRILTTDPTDGTTREVHRIGDAAWVELVPGSPSWVGERLLTVEDHADLGAGGTRTLCLDGRAVTPAGLQVRQLLGARSATGEVAGVEADVLATPADDPTRIDSYRVLIGDDGATALTCETAAEAPGRRTVVPGRATPDADGDGEPPWVEVTATLDTARPTVTVGWRAPDGTGAMRLHVHALEVVSEEPVLQASPRLLSLGERGLRAALLLPSGDAHPDRLPVLLDPYGGPHAQRVVAAGTAYLASQWLADQGFAVLVVDGRGTPGRGPAFERAVHHDLAGPVLEDQIEALAAAVAMEPRLDPDRVAVRGWSFGGYLAALAVLRRPDLFHAAVAGAPVTDWHLYDTHYTERYLGHPDEHPEAYAVSSLVDADGRLSLAADWDTDVPELLLIHGLADDNVVAAHTLRLSSALLAEGRDHQVLPLSGVTHMTPQEIVAERLLELQVSFLHRALG